MNRRFRLLAATLLLASATAAHAEEAAPAQLDAVQVEGLRNPQVFDIDRGIEVRSKFRALAGDQRDALALNFYLVGKGKNAPEDLASVQLVIDTTDGYLDVPVDSHGRLALPDVPPALVKASELFSDQPKRSLEIVYKVDIAADGENAISVAQARRGVGQARAAWKAILPGMARATVPKFNCIEFQFRGAGAVSADDAPLAAGESIKLPLADIPAGAQQLTWSGDLSRLAACKE
jgi:hypothetical protein